MADPQVLENFRESPLHPEGMLTSLRMECGTGGALGLIGIVLITLAWLFFGVFMSFYSALVLPWLADKAPALIATSAPLPTVLIVGFILSLLGWILGTVLFAIRLLEGA